MKTFGRKACFKRLIPTWLLFLCAPALVQTAPGRDSDWPEFRGPTGQGIADEADPPLHWSPTQNIAWKRFIPGEGWSSPILYQGSLYLTTALTNEQDHPVSLRLIRVDAATGEVIWDREVFARTGPSPRQDKNSHASATPIARDGHIYAHFGHMGTACVDLAGDLVWTQTEINYSPMHGNGGSPILVDDKLIFSCDGTEDPFVVGLDKETGAIAWKTARHKTDALSISFSTPLLVREGGEKVVVSPGSGHVAAYNPVDGREIWRVLYGKGFSVVPRPVYSQGHVFIGTGFMSPSVLAVRMGGRGDVTDSHLTWKTKSYAPKTPSMLCYGKELYYVADNSYMTCADALTGKEHWQQRLGGTFSASPVLAGDRLYVVSEKGVTSVIAAGTTYTLLAKNDLAEKSFASPAVSGKAIFIRTEHHLHRIEAQGG
ncbi:MAG: PQQ-binding-like beta-propeller repeat protein [Planctomycetes bacterium]|nr:PQQ-binding-like beta-propeller repeat protein [Planctomycetota bacterium]